MIRWRIVIHGGIDGYSRLVTFLHASANNRAETVLSVFMNAINEFGLLSRICTDKGGENVLIAQYMLGCPDRGSGRGSIIAGEAHITRELNDFGVIYFLAVSPSSTISFTFLKMLVC